MVCLRGMVAAGEELSGCEDAAITGGTDKGRCFLGQVMVPIVEGHPRVEHLHLTKLCNIIGTKGVRVELEEGVFVGVASCAMMDARYGFIIRLRPRRCWIS